MLENTIGRLSVKNDFVFKRLFAKKGNENFLKEFLSELLKMEINTIKIAHDIVLEKNIKDEKLGILDIKAQLDNGIHINIEMQRSDEKNIVKRSTFYASNIIASQLKKRENYKNLKPVIVIFIMDFNHFETKEYITKTVTVSDKDRKYEINEDMVYYYIELPKFRNTELDIDNKVEQWLAFVDGENKEELRMAIKNNDLIKMADEELEYLTGDEHTKRLAELRDKYIIELETAKSDGFEDGEKNEKIKIAKNMLNKNIKPEFIADITGLSISQIDEII